ncbi:hypothetical protein A4S06_01200 [Erysipelotrichaceae bacterium MTC7]|nr:hypothetical protein A4S06_01200 [Erysipelotrichaceae bacterium MTC7]
MLTARMIKIIGYLENNHVTSYKDIATSLDLGERLVRYDIVRINELLSERHYDQIEKQSKGKLIVPKDFNLLELEDDSEFVYSQKERIDLLCLLLIMNPTEFKLNRFSDHFQVSRSTIKNDLNILNTNFREHRLEIVYKNAFFIDGTPIDVLEFSIDQLKQYIYVFQKIDTELNLFELNAKSIICEGLGKVNPKHIIQWFNELLESMNYTITDESYQWFVANIFIVLWHVEHNREHPMEVNAINGFDLSVFEEPLKDLELIVGKNISPKLRKIIVRAFNYTHKYNHYRRAINIDQVEKIVRHLIRDMALQTQIPFDNDSILFEGLMNHMEYLLVRLEGNVSMSDGSLSLLSTKELEIYELVCRVIKNIDILNTIQNEDEITYLTIHFIASIKRTQQTMIKRVLLVCGFGYGTTMLMKESLITQYQIQVVDIIPVYKLDTFMRWDEVDMVISASRIDTFVPKKVILVNPIFKEEDYNKIDKLGIPKKSILKNYYTINKNLDFLNDTDRLKVLQVIQSGLGLHETAQPTKINKLSDILTRNMVSLVEQDMEWEEAVHESAKILIDNNYISTIYEMNIIETMKNMGFYAITDDMFSLLHGDHTAGVNRTGMSLIVNKKKVFFDDKGVNLIFCLASIDKREHIPAVISLIRMVKQTDFINKAKMCDNTDELYDLLLECEYIADQNN